MLQTARLHSLGANAAEAPPPFCARRPEGWRWGAAGLLKALASQGWGFGSALDRTLCLTGARAELQRGCGALA